MTGHGHPGGGGHGPDHAVDGPASGFVGGGHTEVVDPEQLRPVDDHRRRIFDALGPLEPLGLGLSEAMGCVLAEDVVATEDLPPFANSAMDGYAVVSADLAGATREHPTVLTVVGEVAAGPGDPPTVSSGRAVRIMTGAPLPDGADAVVPVELTQEAAGQVEISVSVPDGANIRDSGEDLRAGSRLLRRGRRLRAGDVGALAAVGHTDVSCHPRPRVVVVSTGSELVRADRPVGPGQIRDANGPMLISLVREAGAVPFWAGIVGDDRTQLLDAFDSNLGHADMVVTSGGVSAGTKDYVRDVLAMLGEVEVTKVAMKPGMPQLFGHLRGLPVFGLPGNPVSSFVSFEVFVRPALRVLQGRRDRFRPTVTAGLAEDVTAPRGKRTYLRVRLRRERGTWVAALAGGQGSHQLSTLVSSDGLAEIPATRTQMAAGDNVTVHLLVDPS